MKHDPLFIKNLLERENDRFAQAAGRNMSCREIESVSIKLSECETDKELLFVLSEVMSGIKSELDNRK